MAPCGRDTVLTQLSLSQVYASRLETRNSRAARNWFVAFLRKFSAQSVRSSCLRDCFFNVTSVRKQNFKNKRQTSRVLDADTRHDVEESSNFDTKISMHNASRSAQSRGIQDLTWIKDAESCCFGGLWNFGPYKILLCIPLYLSMMNSEAHFNRSCKRFIFGSYCRMRSKLNT